MSAVVALRPLAVDDAEVMSSVLGDPSLYEFTGGEPPTVDELKERYAFQTRGHSPDGTEEWINLIVTLEPDDTPIGFVQATVQRGGAAAIAWVIGRPWQGRGHASRAVQLLVDHLTELGVVEIVADIHPDHAASQAVARRLGMRRTAAVVDGEQRWHKCLANDTQLPAG